MVAHTTISHGRRTVAFGMDWFAIEDGQKPRREAKALAKRAHDPLDIIVERPGEMPQFALAASVDGARAGAHSAAAIVAESHGGDSWIYVLDLGDLFWVCAGRGGFVLPDGDKVYESENDAKSAFKALSPETFKHIALPEGWLGDTSRNAFGGEAEDVSQTSRERLLDFDVPSWARLRKASEVQTLVQAAIALVLIGGIGLVGKSFYDARTSYQPDPDAAKARMRALSLERERERDALFARFDARRPWEAAPAAADRLSDCLAAFSDVPRSTAGYALTEATCRGETIVARVENHSGYARWLSEWDAANPQVQVAMAINGEAADMVWERSELPARGTDPLDQGRAFPDVARTIFEAAQIDGAGLDMNQPSPANRPDYPDYVPLYATADFSLETQRPRAWREIVADIPGLVITSIVFANETETYTIEGRLHVPNV